MSAAILMGVLIYEKHVLGNPFKIYRDEDGTFKFMSKEMYYESKLSEYGAKLKENPDDEGLKMKVIMYGVKLSKLRDESSEQKVQ